MNKLFLFFSLLTISNFANGQTKALTESGREVILFDNNTWKYSQEDSDHAPVSIDSLVINKNKFTKSVGATFLVKSTAFNVGVYMNPTKWTFAPHKDNETSPEYRFSLKSGDGYVMMITEKTQFDLEDMRKIALLNAQKASIDVKETNAEYRIVNNLKILCITFQGTIKGIKFTYFGYYYSNPNGTVQLISFCSQQSFDRIKKDLETFLNGIVEIQK